MAVAKREAAEQAEETTEIQRRNGRQRSKKPLPSRCNRPPWPAHRQEIRLRREAAEQAEETSS